METSETEPIQQKLRTSVFGYRRSDVARQIAEAERQLAEAREECERLRDQPTEAEGLGEHLADLVQRFAETIAAAEQDAAARAAKVVADAEARAAEIEETARQLLVDTRDLASATYGEAGRRYEAVTAARATADVRVKDAIEQLAAAVASLEAIPTFPDLTPPVPAQGAAGEWEFGSTTTERATPQFVPPSIPMRVPPSVPETPRPDLGTEMPADDDTADDEEEEARQHLAAFEALVNATRAEDNSGNPFLDETGS